MVSKILFYLAPVWEKAMQVSVNPHKPSGIYRRTVLWVYFAFCTVSEDAGLGMPILANYMMNTYTMQSLYFIEDEEGSINR